MRAQRGHKLPKLAPFYAAIRAYVAERGDTTIAELRTWLLATHKVKRRSDLAHVETAWPVAQKKSLRAAEQDRPDVAKARAEWCENQPKLDAGRLIFIDETWTKTNMVSSTAGPKWVTGWFKAIEDAGARLLYLPS